jgi:hypothetical protein
MHVSSIIARECECARKHTSHSEVYQA